MLKEPKKITDEEISDLVDLAANVSEQKRRATDRTTAIREAQKKIKDRGEFIPKNTNTVDTIRICF